MEQNVQVIAKRVCQAVRVAFYILRKNIIKRKLLLDLKYFSMKRPKLAGGGAYKSSSTHAPFSEQEGESEMHAVERVLDSMMTAGQNDVVDEEEDHEVDEAAEMFIQRFYAQLRQQRVTDAY